MTFEELLVKSRETMDKVNILGLPFMAIQVNIIGKNGGVFYAKIEDGKYEIEPYEYKDRSCAISLEQHIFLKILSGELDPAELYTTGKLKVDGDLAKAMEFSKLIKRK